LQVQLERRYTHGWQYRLAYTLSKTKDNGEGAFDAVADRGINFIEPYATSRLDFPHVFSAETVWDVPFGKGKQWGSDIPSALDAVASGWQINAIWRIQSGQTFDVRRNGVRVDVVGDPYMDGPNQLFLNRTAFVDAPSGRFGNLERNGLRGPSTNQLNLGITKNFNVIETVKIQFRTEIFNLFNSPQLTPPNTDLNNGDPVTGFGKCLPSYQRPA
jgi:hypothetical protein